MSGRVLSAQCCQAGLLPIELLPPQMRKLTCSQRVSTAFYTTLTAQRGKRLFNFGQGNSLIGKINKTGNSGLLWIKSQKPFCTNCGKLPQTPYCFEHPQAREKCTDHYKRDSNIRPHEKQGIPAYAEECGEVQDS